MENSLKAHSLKYLHIGIASTITLYLMGIIDRFKELYPSTQICIHEGPSLTLLDELLDFKHDICFIGILNRVYDNLCFFRFPEVERMIFVVGPESPLDTHTDATWEELVNQPFIVPLEGSNAREVVLSEFRSRGFEPVIAAEVANIEFAKELVRQNKGVALMFYPNVKEDIAAKKLRIVKMGGVNIQLGIDIAVRRELTLSPWIEEFLELVKARFNRDFLFISCADCVNGGHPCEWGTSVINKP
jgi:DNA-binding transcriptional LysR family regulator